jgi:hypothetical protein
MEKPSVSAFRTWAADVISADQFFKNTVVPSFIERVPAIPKTPLATDSACRCCFCLMSETAA